MERCGEPRADLQAGSGDVSADLPQHKAGKIRILAVYADKRLPGDAANIPTAKEAGYDFTWPIIRGFYLGPKVSDADYKTWSDTFKKMMATPAAIQRLAESPGLRKEDVMINLVEVLKENWSFGLGIAH